MDCFKPPTKPASADMLAVIRGYLFKREDMRVHLMRKSKAELVEMIITQGFSLSLSRAGYKELVSEYGNEKRSHFATKDRIARKDRLMRKKGKKARKATKP